ncbi:alanine racemase [Aurantimonas sp. Leaf443]|uniref:alanine racemase n=1 Tax=Aurantimonas sp. Leaf443 TaxID=1736378 RepID=UPI0006F7B51A|nr:alanine racemase [Aurantimonas sp. Leaf443]KQT88387.1 alanine racemase [Aurantimonas sp. Leaf443]
MEAPAALLPRPAAAAPADRQPIVTIDAAALAANWTLLSTLAPASRTGAAVKADGYGLGAAEVARTLRTAGCRDFFVAWPSEGANLREFLGPPADIVTVPVDGSHESEALEEPRIFVLQGMEASAVPLLLRHRLIPVLSTPDDVAAWQTGLRLYGARAPAAVQIETGMNRLGLDERPARAVADAMRAGSLDLVLLMSHLASADEETDQSEQQRMRFLALSVLFPGLARSLANSAGVFRGAPYHFDLTRPGIALYGGEAGAPSRGLLRPVATLSAAILQVREAKAGEEAGYGGAAKLMRDTRIATVGLGYADGYPRSASGAGVPVRARGPGAEAVIAGRRVPVLGRVSMDLTLLDVTDVPEDAIAPGDRAEFFGPAMPMDEVALAAGTISYELLTSLGPRVKRVWLRD